MLKNLCHGWRLPEACSLRKLMIMKYKCAFKHLQSLAESEKRGKVFRSCFLLYPT